MSWSMALRRSPKAGALTAAALNVPRILLTTSVDSASPSMSSAMMNSGLPRLNDLLEQRQQLADRGDLALVDQDVRVVEDRLHALGVGDEVRRDVALVELHALGELELGAECVGLLDGDDAVLADLVERLGDQFADRAVARRDRGHVGHVLGRVDSSRGLDQRGDTASTALSMPRLRSIGLAPAATARRPSCTRAWAITVAVVVPSPATSLVLVATSLSELGAEVLEGVVELHLTGDGDAVVGDGGGAPLLVEDDVAALGAERHLDGVGERVDSTLEGPASVLVELQDLRHSGSFRSDNGPGVPRDTGLPGRYGLLVWLRSFTSRRPRGRHARRG